MHEPVHSIFHSKLLSALRLPSFAGEGLPERMRSISFALLGLTAAAGLALVAIFAQPSFSLLSPAPLPDQPSAGQSVAEAKKLPLAHRPVALFAAQSAHSQRASADAMVQAPSSDPSGAAAGGGETAVPPATVDVPPAPAGAPEPSGGNSGGGGNETGTGGGSGSDPAAAPEPSAGSPSTPASPSAPPSTRPEPEATTSVPKPEPAPGPGNSASAAAAGHASERGIEASADAGGGATTTTVAPEPASPGNGNGLAKGQDK